jgi:hypothetical protein
METDTLDERIETTVGIQSDKYDLYVAADNLIAERLGRSPGPEALMSAMIENEDDPVIIAELYCLSLLHKTAAA